ncbi:MAG TPA: pitrilysin family protein [Pyrinomonadaceae bacterium]|nr:pitrilysin family protein [Pyrinomonadaceae bacterium]
MKSNTLRRNLSVFALAAALLCGSLVAPASAAIRQRNAARPARPAQQRPQPSPTPAAGPLAEAAPFVNKVLPNGLEVIVLEDHSVPLVTVELAVRNGSFTEPPELNGLSHLFEHMFFKVSPSRGRITDYMRDIDSLGIVYNGETHEEVVNYYFTTTTPNFPVAMRYMRDQAVYPGFSDEYLARVRSLSPQAADIIRNEVEQQFAQEREVVVGELDRHESNPYGELNVQMNNRLFYKYPSRKDPGGSRQTVRAATLDVMRTIQARYYVPNNSAIVVTGDVTPAEAFRVVEELFGEWKRRERNPFEDFPLVEHPPLAKSEAGIITKPVSNVVIQLGWHGPSIGKDDAATYAADVFSFILRQPNSRFQRALTDSGLAAVAGFGYYTQRNVGPITLILQTTPEKAKAAAAAAYKEIEHFNDPDYFTDEELESAKALLEADDLYSREKLSEYSHTLSFWWASTGTDYFRGYLKRLRATSRADISRYLTTYVQGKPHVGLALMSEEALKASGLTEADLLGAPPAPKASTATAGK